MNIGLGHREVFDWLRRRESGPFPGFGPDLASVLLVRHKETPRDVLHDC